MMGNQRLVGGNNGAPGRNGGFSDSLGCPVGAADQLYDNIGLGVSRHRDGIVKPLHPLHRYAAVAPPVARRYRSDRYLAPASLGQNIAIFLNQMKQSGANSA